MHQPDSQTEVSLLHFGVFVGLLRWHPPECATAANRLSMEHLARELEVNMHSSTVR